MTRHVNARGVQFVWWGRIVWPVVYLLGPYPKDGVNRGAIYRWRLVLGPLEIRRWARGR